MPEADHQQEPLDLAASDKPREFRIIFDGGSLGNPGKGYGSYEIVSGCELYKLGREKFCGSLTNNQAEYMTLIEALKWLANDLGELREEAVLTIHGDSQLVVNQINGTWKVKNRRMIPLVEEATKLLGQFRQCAISWHPRARSFERLGH